MNFIQQSIKQWKVDCKNILELGCGGCVLLEQLKSQGYNLTGIDPSPVAKRAGEKKSLRVINDFFPSSAYAERPDVIFHCHVLEHVPDPVQFLKNQRDQLTDDGLIIMALPDCNEPIERGEISMSMHQHFSYFDNESLANTVEAAGLKVLSIETAAYGGSVYCCAIKTNNKGGLKKTGLKKFENFRDKVDINFKKIVSAISVVLEDPDRTAGFYVPLRALPYISVLGDVKNYRFFDDTPDWYNCSFDGVDAVIENFLDLTSRPVTDLFIMSFVFGDEIKKKVRLRLPEMKNIKTLRELLE